MMFSLPKTYSFSSMIFWGVLALAAATEASAADKFQVSSVACEMFWYSKHTPTLHYNIADVRRSDYNQNPTPDYFRQAAQRTREYCDRTSSRPQTLYDAPRRIVGIWFEANDGAFKALYNLDTDGIDSSAGVTNRIGDRYAAEQRALVQRAEAERRHQAQLDEIATRDSRARALKEAQEKAQLAKAAAERAREDAFLANREVQIARLGTEVTRANFALIENVRTNPFHYKKLGLAVVPARFNRMISENRALFGNELAPLIIQIRDIDRFTQAGEIVMLAFKVQQRGEAERSYGSLPEIIISTMKADPVFGEYVGAYTCPAGNCTRIFDVSPPS